MESGANFAAARSFAIAHSDQFLERLSTAALDGECNGWVMDYHQMLPNVSECEQEDSFSTRSTRGDSRKGSSSSYSDTSQSTTAVPLSAELTSNASMSFRLIWPREGQLSSGNASIRRVVTQGMQEGRNHGRPAASPKNLSPTESHHEATCLKCRLTDVEARNCRVDRRRDQNRASQRKFRARKEAKIRDGASQVATLEKYVESLEAQNKTLEKTNARMGRQLADLQNSLFASSEEQSLYSLYGHTIQFD